MIALSPRQSVALMDVAGLQGSSDRLRTPCHSRRYETGDYNRAVADGSVEARCVDTCLSASDLGSKCLDKQRGAVLLSMMLLTHFG